MRSSLLTKTVYSVIKNILQKVEDFCLPAHCVLCQVQCESRLHLCDACRHDLPLLQNQCERCHRQLSAQQSGLCGHCLTQPPAYHRCYVFWDYALPMDYFIKQLKFSHQLHYAQMLGRLFSEKIVSSYAQDQLPQAIIPMPLHRQRLRERGFNQTLEIAKPVSRALAIPLLKNSCQRIRATRPQAQLPARARKKNLQQVFRIIDLPPEINHVAILDDVITTGHTANALAAAFSKVAKRIDVWCCASTAKSVLNR
jgi:ComF family protein